MSENTTEDLEDWFSLFNDDYGPWFSLFNDDYGRQTCTFIEADGSLLEGNNIEPDQIAEVLYSHQEENTWGEWSGEILVHLKDGNFAYLTAWANTTFRFNNHFIAESLETLSKYAMSPEEEKTIKENMKGSDNVKQHHEE